MIFKAKMLFQNGRSVSPDLGPVQEEIKKVFEFKSGQQPNTKGIHILDKPFILDCKQNGSGNKVNFTAKKLRMLRKNNYFTVPSTTHTVLHEAICLLFENYWKKFFFLVLLPHLYKYFFAKGKRGTCVTE